MSSREAVPKPQQAPTPDIRVDLLRESCAVLHRSSSAVTAISVTDCLRGRMQEAPRLLMLATRLAEEFNFEHEVCFDGDYFTVRFSRPYLRLS